MAGRSKGSGRQGGEGAGRQLKVRVKSGTKRRASSRQWLERQLNDPYVAAAQREGLRSRAAFKLIEIDDKHHFLKPGNVVVDLGAAPGGWTQVLADRVKSHDGLGQVVALDILEMEPIAGAEVIQLDFMEETQRKTWLLVGCVFLVLLAVVACVGAFVLDYLGLLPAVFYEPLRWLGLI